ncbi:MAG: SDR family oxidoreductase [Flavobacteriales bacterium]|nr:SDR family oxidoreductase [Flavobacteriales bacterium]
MTAPLLLIGASSGIGQAIAHRSQAQGIPFITAGRRATSFGVPHITYDASTGPLPQEQLPAELGGLVYCPGSIDLKPLRSTRADDLRTAFELNAVGAFLAVQACAERLKKVPGSGIVLFSTVAVARGMAFHTTVAAAKGAVEGLTRSLAAELAPHVRVNCIAPSLTRTPLAEKLLSTPEREAAGADRHPLKRVGEAAEVAAMATFLLSDEARWITGQVLAVDGGLSTL